MKNHMLRSCRSSGLRYQKGSNSFKGLELKMNSNLDGSEFVIKNFKLAYDPNVNLDFSAKNYFCTWLDQENIIFTLISVNQLPYFQLHQ